MNDPPMVLPLLVFLPFILASVVIGVSTRRGFNRYYHDVEVWASGRGWICRAGAGGRTWKTPLPRVGNSSVQLQVDGTRAGHAFTLVYAKEVYWSPTVTLEVELTVVVVYLRSCYPAAKVTRRSTLSRRTSDTIGHAEFDKKFQVRTDAQGNPAAVVSIPLAEAHLAGAVPQWTLRDRELMCYTNGRPRVEDLDTAVERAVWVAELLGVV